MEYGLILLVEDDRLIAALTRTILESAGYEVVWVENGELALTALELSRFDVCLTDLQMPQMDGTELVQAIRADRRFCDMPVVAISGNEPSLWQTPEFDFDLVLSKPISSRQLLRALSSVQSSLALTA